MPPAAVDMRSCTGKAATVHCGRRPAARAAETATAKNQRRRGPRPMMIPSRGCLISKGSTEVATPLYGSGHMQPVMREVQPTACSPQSQKRPYSHASCSSLCDAQDRLLAVQFNGALPQEAPTTSESATIDLHFTRHEAELCNVGRRKPRPPLPGATMRLVTALGMSVELRGSTSGGSTSAPTSTSATWRPPSADGKSTS
mmetsp:Transcript_18025/g.38718  ORF Transcript_18025/g.38718 Transcript_18025/m.38718 type:complete len:200 (-) Transcript_18025:63-662(-)